MSHWFTPRPCQIPMIEHIINNERCAVWAGCGMGKGSSVLAALHTLSLVEDIFPVLILGPLRVARSTWFEEIQKWQQFCGLQVSRMIGIQGDRKLALTREADIYCTNYENLPWLSKQVGDRWPFKTCVADESTRLKSFRIRQGGKRAHVLNDYAFDKIKRFIQLTGTPAPNGLHDLWGQLYLLDRGERLGKTFEAFEQRWFAYRRKRDAYTRREYVETIILPHSEKEIHDRVKDICLSVNAADYFDIQKPIEVKVYVDLPVDARKVYNSMEKEMFFSIDNTEVEAFSAASRSNKCLQLANGAVYVDPYVLEDADPASKSYIMVHDRKIEALESIITECNGTPVLVAYNFRSDLERLIRAFPKGRHISTQQDEDDFKAGKIPIGFAHPASLGHGVDGFQYATNIGIFFGLTWNFENYEQFIERFGPMRQIQAGFDRSVFVYLIVARDTVDEEVLIRHETKCTVQEALLNSARRPTSNDYARYY